MAIGVIATTNAANGVAIGENAIANNAGDVALGAGSTTASAMGTTGTTINGINYSFAGIAPTSTVSVGALGAERTITNVAAGQISGTSTDAINGSELYATNQAVNSLASGASGVFVSDNTAAAANPVASGTNASAGGFGASATGASSTAVGNSATDNGVANSSVFGNGATISAGLTGANVALGQGSAVTSNAQGTSGTSIGGVAYGFAGTVPVGEVSVGTVGGERVVTNVAAASLSGTSTDAVNGSQLFATNQSVGTVSTNLTTLGNSTSASLGGGSTYTATGGVSAPAYTVGGTSYNSVGGAITALADGVGSPVQYSNAATPTTPNGGVASQDVTLVGATAGTTVAVNNVAPGTLSATSTQAVNGSQLNSTNTSLTALGSTTASSLGGGSTYSAAGGVTAPSYTIGGTSYNNVGSALSALSTDVSGGGIEYFHANSTLADSTATGTNSVAVGPVADAAGASSTAVGSLSRSMGTSSVAIGNGAIANNAGDVALGSGSTTSAVVATTGTTINGTAYTFAGTAPTSTVSVGVSGAERTITNVAAGQITATSTDAINGSELYATNQAVNALSSGGSGPLQYSNAGTPTTPNGGVASQNVTLVGATAGTPVAVNNMAAGTLSASSTQGVNGSQLYATNTQVNSNTSDIASLATALGGGATYNSSTGSLTAPTYTIGGTAYNSVGGAIGALAHAAGSAVQYSNAATPTTPNGGTVTNDVTLVGASSGAVVVHNVAAGTAPTDAVDVAQLNAVTVGKNPNAVIYSSAAPNLITLSSPNNGGSVSAPVAISNVAAGQVSATSNQAVNGSQLYATNQSINNLANYTTQGFANLNSEIGTVQQEAYAGTAAAIAAAGLHYDQRPGKVSTAAAASYYHGQAGFAGGIGSTSENNDWSINAGFTVTPGMNGLKADFGALVGATHTWN